MRVVAEITSGVYMPQSVKRYDDLSKCRQWMLQGPPKKESKVCFARADEGTRTDWVSLGQSLLSCQ
jgi:hypothetical protein